MSSARISGTLGVLAMLCVGIGQAQEKEVAWIAVTTDGLKQEIVRKRGKVVLVDFWASFCSPCRKAFPHLLDMHKKYTDKGFVVVTVAVDDPKEPKQLEAAHAFLRQVRSPFLNLHLQESPEVWTKKLDFVVSLPCYYVFDRQGKWVRFGGADSDQGINYDALEKVVVRMLSEK